MKTSINLLAILLIIATTFNPSFAQTQVGQDIRSTQGGSSNHATSLSFDGNRMAVVLNDRIEMYELTNNQWVQIASNNDYSVRVSISADGNRVSATGFLGAQCRVYELVNGNLVQLGADISDFPDYAYTSLTLSADGNRVAVGAHVDNAIQVYEWNGTDWVQMGATLDGEMTFESFGRSVSLSWDGSVLAVGASFNTGANGNRAGHVRVFEWSGTNWLQIGADIDGQYPDDEFGHSVSLSGDGNRFAVGAPNNLAVGQVRVYERVANDWVQLGVDLRGNEFYHRLGHAVALSADGNTMVSSSGVSAGLVTPYAQAYEWIGGEWINLGTTILADNNDDRLNYTSISGDGSRLSIGISGDGTEGYTRVYNTLLTLPIQLAHFKASVINKEVLLNWSTASETNNAGFDIEHSTDGTNWQMLGFERGQGTSQNSHTYNYTHETPQTDINYYRLKQVDFDGSFEYSEMVSARIYGRDGVEVFPNPTFGEVYISGIDYEELNIINALGKTIFNLTTPQSNIDISHLPNGTYFIQLRQGDTHFVQKIVKE